MDVKFVKKMSLANAGYSSKISPLSPLLADKLLPNGDIYSGDWFEGCKHGFGIQKCRKGDIYEGEF
jgi:hypothetical protein